MPAAPLSSPATPPTAKAPAAPGRCRGARRSARPDNIKSAIASRQPDTARRIGFGSSVASTVRPNGVVTAQPATTQRSDRQSIWRQTLGSRLTVVSSSTARKAGITCAGGSTIDSAPMPIIDEPKPDSPRTTKAASEAAPIQARVSASKPSIERARIQAPAANVTAAGPCAAPLR